MPSSSRAARSRRHGCCCVVASGTRPTVVGRYLMFHLQTLVLGYSRSGSTRTGAATSRISWTTRSSVTPRVRRRHAPSGSRTSAAASSSTAAAATRSRKRSTHHPGASTAPAWRSRSNATGWPPSRCRARTSRKRRIASTSTRRSATSGACRPAESRTPRTPRHRVRAAIGARGSRPSCSEAGAHAHVLGHVAGDAGHDRAGPPTHLAPLDGHRADGYRPRDSVCDPWQRLWDVDNVLVADSSVFPTSSGYGPTLTIVALALRAAHARVVVVTRHLGRVA